MASLTVVDSIPAHVPLMVEQLRREPRFDEIDVRHVLWRSYRNSLVRRTAFWGDEIAVMGGCSGVPLSGVGELWLCTANLVEKMPLSFIKQARKELIKTLMVFPRVFGKVSTTYKTAPDFLRFMGFTLEEPTTSPNGVVYQRFWMDR